MRTRVSQGWEYWAALVAFRCKEPRSHPTPACHLHHKQPSLSARVNTALQVGKLRHQASKTSMFLQH